MALVYATTLWLHPPEGLAPILQTAAAWLGQKAQEYVHPDTLIGTRTRHFADGSHLQSTATRDAPQLVALRYSHPDLEVHGRQWSTELGIRELPQPQNTFRCTVVLSTSEVSTRVEAPIRITRPILVPNLVKACAPTPQTWGLDARSIEPGCTRSFSYWIEDRTRRHPLVLVSPTNEGTWLVDIPRLASLLLGIAEVTYLDPGANSRQMQELIGQDYTPWGGAVAILGAPVRRQESAFIPNQRILPQDLLALAENGGRPEDEILARITHRTNWQHAHQHLSVEDVARESLQRELAHVRRQAAAGSSESSAYIALLEEEHESAEQKLAARDREIEDLQAQVALYTAQIDELEADRHALTQRARALQEHLGEAQAARARNGHYLDTGGRAALLNILQTRATLLDCLTAMAGLFPERIVVLDSAWKSAADSQFKDVPQAWLLLLKLATAYWEGLSAGQGDTQVRAVFGSHYAANESEIAASNSRARALRTFPYRGADVVMEQHLRIGVKDSRTATLRVHFHWDAERRAIVIGHCGRHLDHPGR